MIEEVNLRCIASFVDSGEPPCWYRWTETRKIDTTESKYGPFEVTYCPNCGKPIALAPHVKEKHDSDT